MNKTELSEILHECCDNVYDSITANEDQNTYPRIVYWSYLWDYITGSGAVSEDLRTYQVSIWGKTPPEQNPAVNALRSALRERGMFPTFHHEYVKDDKAFHTFLAVEAFEDGEG